jgi:hypothetical protein
MLAKMASTDIGRSIGLVLLVGVGVGVTVAVIGHYAGISGAPLGGLAGGVTAVLVGRLRRKPQGR